MTGDEAPKGMLLVFRFVKERKDAAMVETSYWRSQGFGTAIRLVEIDGREFFEVWRTLKRALDRPEEEVGE